METYTHDDDDDRNDVGVRAESTQPSGGIYSLPVIGNAAAGVRHFYDEVAPKESDSTELRVVKEIFRVSSAVAGAAAVGMIVL